jgi:chemotaxis protein MotA
MAIALLSTFYGLVFANLCFVPLSNKLREFMDHEEMRLELVQEGILDLYDEENPWAIKYKLEALSAGVLRPNSTWKQPKLVLMGPKKRASSVAS